MSRVDAIMKMVADIEELASYDRLDDWADIACELASYSENYFDEEEYYE